MTSKAKTGKVAPITCPLCFEGIYKRIPLQSNKGLCLCPNCGQAVKLPTTKRLLALKLQEFVYALEDTLGARHSPPPYQVLKSLSIEAEAVLELYEQEKICNQRKIRTTV